MAQRAEGGVFRGETMNRRYEDSLRRTGETAKRMWDWERFKKARTFCGGGL